MVANRLRTCAITLLLLFTASAAYATDAATADALFREGREAMKRGDYEAASKRFAESDRLQPAPGTKLNLAAAESKTSRLASAWEHARAARDEFARTDERYMLASSLFDELERRVPRLLLRSAKPLPPSAHVNLDGTELRVIDVALPLDPGPHHIVVSSPETEDASYDVSLQESSKTILDIALGPRRTEKGATLSPKPTVTPTQSRPSSEGSSQRTIGYVFLASSAGAALFGGASLIVRESITQSYNANPKCDTPESSPECQSQVSSRTTWLGLAIGAFAGAGVLAGVGVTLLFTAPSETKTAVRCGVAGTSLTCVGTF